MAALAWLLIPVIAAVASGLWGSWAGRRRTTTPDAVGVAGYERFRAAMERTRTEAAEPPEAADAGGAYPRGADRTAADAPRGEAVPAVAAPVHAGAVAHPVPEASGRAGG